MRLNSLVHGIRALAEERELIEVVAEIGEEQHVTGRAEPGRRDARRLLEPGNQQILAVLPIRVAEESPEHPREPPARAGHAHLLRPHLRGRRVVERRIERVDVLRETDGAAGDAGRQRRRIADDDEVAVRIGRHGGEREIVAEAVRQVDVGEHEVVVEVLLELRELLPLAERHRRPRGREGIRDDVERVDAVPSIHRHTLVDDARRDREAVVRLQLDGGAKAGPVPVVDVLADGPIGLNRVDESRDAVVIRDHAQGGLRAERCVEPDLRVSAHAPAVDDIQIELREALRDVHLRLVGDVAHGAGQRARAEQRPLRTAQHFHAVGVEQIEIRCEERQRDGRLVEVDADLFLHARLIAHDLPGRYAADRHLALTGPEVLHGQSGDVRRDALEVVDAAPPQDLLGGRRDRERHVEQRLLALRGGDGHLFGQGRFERRVELT